MGLKKRIDARITELETQQRRLEKKIEELRELRELLLGWRYA